MEEKCIKKCFQKINKEIKDSWDDLAQEFGYKDKEHLRCKFKRYRNKKGLLQKRENIKSKEIENKLTQLDLQKIELRKEKIRLQDQKTALNALIRSRARQEEINEIIDRAIKEKTNPFVNFIPIKIKSDNDLLIFVNDVHYGLDFNHEFFGNFNPEICVDRFKQYLTKIIQIKSLHNSQKANIFLGGDIISGIIHTQIRISNSKDTIEQIMDISEIISDFIYEIAKEFTQVNIYYVAGNHSRLFEDKKQSLKDEKLDLLIPYYIKTRLKGVNNINIITPLDSTIAKMNIRNKLYYGVHGDYDPTAKSAVQNLTLVLEEKPYAICMAHMHHNATDTIQGVKTIMSGSFVGIDPYCIEKRITGHPSQMVCVCTNDGVECFYDVNFK